MVINKKLEKKFFIISIICLSNNIAFANNYKNDMSITHESVSDKTYQLVLKKLSERNINSGKTYDNTQFGVHGMETPFLSVKSTDLKAQDLAFELLSKAGVDSLRSTEAAWHRIADKNGDPDNLDELLYQLREAKKYNLSHLFVVGYPPAKYTVAHNKLSAVRPEDYNSYRNYLNTLMKSFSGYNVPYLELGNEVDAPATWWIRSTPQMYVNEMKMLHEAISDSKLNIKTVAFSATYSRKEGLGGANGGRNFLLKSFQLGIDKYTDAYSLHHFDMSKYDDFPSYMHSLLYQRDINKPLFDTEQMDTGYRKLSDSEPYDLIKIYTRGFFLYNLRRIDYFTAKDFYSGNRLYSIGLFDNNWHPKLRLLAYAMASDALKGRHLIKIVSPKPNIEAYILNNAGSPETKFKYTIVIWLNGPGNTVINGLKGSVRVENWDLSESNISADKGINVSNKPIAIYTNEIPDWDGKVKNFNRSGELNIKDIMPN